jgi:hypothetical protein
MPPYLLRPAATEIDWEIIKGDQFDILVPVLDDDQIQIDATGYTAKAQVRHGEDEPVLHEWSAAEGNLDVAADGVTLHVLGAETSLWTFSKALISIEIYEPLTNRPRVIAEGTIRALPEITQ